MAGYHPELALMSAKLDSCRTLSRLSQPANTTESRPPTACVGLHVREHTLIKRQSKLFILQSGKPHDEPTKARQRLSRIRDRRFFRCDIYAASAADERLAHAECKQLVIEAGGLLIKNFSYLGGFLFELPPNVWCPIESGDMTAQGGNIVVEPWQPSGGSTIDQGDIPQPRSEAACSKQRLGTRIDELLRLKKKSTACLSGVACHRASAGSSRRSLTLLEMLQEEYIETKKQPRSSAVTDDISDWETLYDDSDQEA